MLSSSVADSRCSNYRWLDMIFLWPLTEGRGALTELMLPALVAWTHGSVLSPDGVDGLYQACCYTGASVMPCWHVCSFANA